VDVPLCQHICTVLLLRIIKFSGGAVLRFDLLPKYGIFQCKPVFNKAAFGNRTVVNEKMFLPASVTAAIKNDARDKTVAHYVILELTSNVAGEIFSPAGIRVILIHICPQIAIQGALGFFVGSLIEIPAAGFAEKHDLQRINYSGFPCTVFSGEEVDIVDLNYFLGKIQPINQQNLRQFLHVHPLSLTRQQAD